MEKQDKVDMVKAVIKNRGRVLAGKAKEVTEIAKLKAQIMSCEEVIRKNYLEIGEKVFEAYEETENDDCMSENPGEACWKNEVEKRYKKQCVSIQNANKAIEDLKQRIAALQKHSNS